MSKKNIVEDIESSTITADTKEIDKINNKPKTQSKKDKLDFGDEMKVGVISKGNKAKEQTIVGQKATKKRILVKEYNELGQRLTKKGEIDKRPETSKKNLEKSSRYKEILAKKAEDKLNKPVLTPYAESSDSDEELEFEIETIIQPASMPPPPILQPIPFIQEEIAKRKKMDDEMFQLKQENQKLKDNFHFNKHLQRIDMMSRNVKISF
jgi:hypothetical protein